MTQSPATRPIAIVGASCRAAVQRAARAGWFPLAADRFADRDLMACAEVHALDNLELRAQEWVGRFPDLPMLLAGGMENDPELVDRLRACGIRTGLDGAMLKKLRDPENWSVWARETGLKWPQTHMLSPLAVAPPPLALAPPPAAELPPHSVLPSHHGEWLKKSRTGVAGIDVARWWPHINLEPGDYVQEQLHGESIGATFLSDSRSNHYIGCTGSWSASDFPAPGPYVYRGSVGPVSVDACEEQWLSDFGALVREATGLRGLWQADFIRNGAGLWLLEINPRWSASMELLDAAWGLPLVSLHVAAILDETVAFEKPDRSAVKLDRYAVKPDRVAVKIGKCIVYASRDTTPTQSQLDAWWSRRWTGEITELASEVRLADIPSRCDMIPAGYPILTCLAAREDRNDLAAQLGIASACVLSELERV